VRTARGGISFAVTVPEIKCCVFLIIALGIQLRWRKFLYSVIGSVGFVELCLLRAPRGRALSYWISMLRYFPLSFNCLEFAR